MWSRLDAKHWRDCAAEMRALSDIMKDTDAIATMLRLAEDYDVLADRADVRSNGGVLPGRTISGMSRTSNCRMR
jgi:hypothetical protein